MESQPLALIVCAVVAGAWMYIAIGVVFASVLRSKTRARRILVTLTWPVHCVLMFVVGFLAVTLDIFGYIWNGWTAGNENNKEKMK